MRTLFLHIGQGKTGSSYLQSSLANSQQALREFGYDYHQGGTGPALDWRVSSGNGMALIERPAETFAFAEDKVIFSFEGLFGHLALDRSFRDKLRRFCSLHDFGSVRMLLFIRNPVGHAESCYQQDVKRLGATQNIESYFGTYGMPATVNALLSRDLSLPDCRIDVFNYDRHRERILSVLGNFLGVPDLVLKQGPEAPVNRSATPAELVMQRRLNAHMGRFASFFSDAMCNSLPSLAVDRVFPSRDVQTAMLDRVRSDMDAVNALIPQSEWYRDDLRPNSPAPEAHEISRVQLETMAEVLATKLSEAENETRLLRSLRLLDSVRGLLDRGDLERSRQVLDRVFRQLAQLQRARYAPERLAKALQVHGGLRGRWEAAGGKAAPV